MAPVYLADWTNQIARPPENLGEHA
jgi:hypothetical protein